MTKKELAELICSALEELYPAAECSLTYEKPYELMIAARLSAQCTDARVNLVTRQLFEKYTSLEEFARACQQDIEEIIRPCGLYRTKAKSICEMTRQLYYELGGVIPDTLGELTKLSGIGRKTANLIMGDIHGKPAIVTDTHCIRISNRLGLAGSERPEKVEAELRKIVPPKKSSDFCHRLVIFGREYCKAASPRCGNCPLGELCKSH